MGSDRMRRVDEAIRQVIGEALAKDIKDPRVGFVTVTDVRTSADLRHARVYVSVLGDDDQRAASIDGLSSAHGYLQARLSEELRLRRTPALTFTYDDTTDKAMRLRALIDAQARSAGGASPAPDRVAPPASAEGGGRRS